MTTRIHKYQLASWGLTYVSMPAFSEPMHVGFQGSRLMLWATVNPDLPDVDYAFYAFKTGEELGSQPLRRDGYVGTAVTADGSYVAHVYELDERRVPRKP